MNAYYNRVSSSGLSTSSLADSYNNFFFSNDHTVTVGIFAPVDSMYRFGTTVRHLYIYFTLSYNHIFVELAVITRGKLKFLILRISIA